MNGSLPASLAGFRHALEDAIRRDLDAGRTRRRRGLAVRAALAAAVVAAVALGALTIASRQASGASAVRRAAAAIAPSPGTILHVVIAGSQDNGDGTSITWHEESWQQESPPWDRRQIERAPDGSVTEAANENNREEVYDPKTNTIYVSPPAKATGRGQPTWKIVPGPRPGTFILRIHPAPFAGKRPIVLTARQAKALRNGTDVLAFRIAKKNGAMTASPTVMPAPPTPRQSAKPSTPDPDPSSGEFRDQILALLKSGGAHVAGHRTIDGQDVIEIDSADGHTTYFVDPASYAPVELRTRGTDGGTSLRFRTYETLDLAGNESLLSLEANHPTARIDRNPADYQAAEARMFPHG
jgi:hypothetical protein